MSMRRERRKERYAFSLLQLVHLRAAVRRGAPFLSLVLFRRCSHLNRMREISVSGDCMWDAGRRGSVRVTVCSAQGGYRTGCVGKDFSG